MARGLMHRRGQRGQAMVEYIIILPSLLLIIMGAIQLALLFQAKSTLNYATFLAARQGALHNGKNCVGALCSGGGMQLGLASGMMPLAARNAGATGKTSAATKTLELVAGIQTGLLGTITTLNPATAWVNSAKVADSYTGVKGVPNDNLMYRSTAKVGSGTGAMNLQDGNLLKIKVTWCFKLEVPFANQIIYAINNLVPAANLPASALPTGWVPMSEAVVLPGPCMVLNALPADNPLGGKYLPIVSTAVVRMQTPYIGP